MKIAVLGCGAMGMLIGGYLSKENDVFLIDIDPTKIENVNRSGVLIGENDGTTTRMYPAATANSAGIGQVDLVIVFVKALYSETTLASNRVLIGENTYLMTLQNGAGHEDILNKFVSPDRVIVGTTNHNSSIVSPNHVKHGGSGLSFIGSPNGDNAALKDIAENFTACGIETSIDPDIQKLIWGKLFVNVSLSALTGALQVPIGYLGKDVYAKTMMQTLVTEAVAVARGAGMDFDEEEIQARVQATVDGAPDGLTSIYADLRDGRMTEVDTISGAVVRASKRVGVPAPSHELMVNMIHALEGKYT